MTSHALMLHLDNNPSTAVDAYRLQIDDLFLSTAEPFDSTKTYRMTADDSTALATFMANVPSLPAGSNIKVPPPVNFKAHSTPKQPSSFAHLHEHVFGHASTYSSSARCGSCCCSYSKHQCGKVLMGCSFLSLQLEFVTNNAGYIAATQRVQYDSMFLVGDPPAQPQTYYKPPGSAPQHCIFTSKPFKATAALPLRHCNLLVVLCAGPPTQSLQSCGTHWWLHAGTGTNQMPENPDVSWWNPTTWKNDDLYNEIAFGASGLTYFLGHHNFNHENMNACTYYDAEQQIRLNQVQRLLWPCV